MTTYACHPMTSRERIFHSTTFVDADRFEISLLPWDMVERVEFVRQWHSKIKNPIAAGKKGRRGGRSVILCSANESRAEMDRSSGISNFRGG